MFFKFKTHIFPIVVLLCACAVQARTSMCDVPFNLDWKFYKGTPTGMPQNLKYDDGAWTTVSVPHSASYDPPTVAGEIGFYGSPGAPNVNFWYRKKFVCPVSARKVFIHFEAVMQSVIVYVNGTQVGAHYNSGYTGFFYDISNNVSSGDSTCIAVRVNINNDVTIPPGGNNWTTNNGSAPDYFLFSGIYRNVWLLFKDSVYVPLRGQRTATTGTMASPTVHAVTSVRNDAKTAKNVSVALTVRNAAGASVATKSATLSIPATNTSNFDMTTNAIVSPSLWSPGSPTLYSLLTVVIVDGAVVDSVVEPIGLRFYSWSANTPGGLLVNGTLTELKGVCMAQFMGWIENAVPDSRYAKQVAMIKEMGSNSIRTAHYPRGEAFYHACDSLGILVLVECPNWGYNGAFAGVTTFWSRLNSADSAMVLDAYNHPSIYGWSLFNEPTENNLTTQFASENAIVHGIEAVAPAGRVTLVANYVGNIMYPMDIYGMNYTTSTSTNLPIINTENYQNFYRAYVRGNEMDRDVSNSSEANSEWSFMNNVWSTTDKCGGSYFWCFMDYCSYRNQVGREGLVDRLYIPKNVYFMFRKNLTGKATDYWANGTATKVELTADLTALKADGSDISLVVATLRDGNNQCVQQNCNITFAATPGTSVAALYTGHSASPTFGNPVTVGVEGGRAGILLRTSRTPGSITVTATNSCGLATVSTTLVSTAVNNSIPPLPWSVVSARTDSHMKTCDALRLKTVYPGKYIAISFPSGVKKTVRIIDYRGKTMASYTLKNGMPTLVDHNVTGIGIFYAIWDDNGRRMLARLNIIR
jgi:hypothetical protein